MGSVLGWDPSGMGAPIGAPSSFILLPVMTLLQTLAGPDLANLLILGGIGFVCAWSAQSCVRAFTGSTAAQIAGAVFVVFNPWVYTKLVAGHTAMLLSYGGTILLLREFVSPARNQLRMMCCGLLIAPQTQFFAVCFLPAMWYAATRGRRLTLLTWGALAVPVIVGVMVNRSSLLATPLTLAWENSQSIQPAQALVLNGYSTEYAASFAGLAAFGMWTIFALAALGCATVVALDRKWILLPLATAAALLASFGTHAPWADLVRFAFTNVPETGLFRELYDLLGLAAAGYVALCAALARRVPPAGWIWLPASACLLAGWIARPPQTFWVPAGDVPRAPILSPPNTRFALFPAFQPMNFHGRGSGIDPDGYSRADNVTPLNEFFPLYPAVSALESYALDGDTRGLAALSVSCIVERPWLSSNARVIKSQVALVVSAKPARAARPASRCIAPLPELSLSGFPAVGTLDTNFGAGNVFFGDARNARGAGVPATWRSYGATLSVPSPKRFVDAREGWVDARLAFLTDPSLSQPFGGALTVNHNAWLGVRPGLGALVYVRGRLAAADGRTVSGTTRGYVWVAVPSDVSAVRCEGLCVVALQGSPPRLPLNPPARPASGVDFHAYTAWFAVATLPSGPATFLRYNVAYNDLWFAFLGDAALPHVRVDGIVNGWFVPARDAARPLYLIEAGALATAGAEIGATAVIVGAFLAFGLRQRRPVAVRYRQRARTPEPIR